MSIMRAPARPSQFFGASFSLFLPNCRRIASLMASVFVPAIVLVPLLTVTGLSVFSLTVTQEVQVAQRVGQDYAAAPDSGTRSIPFVFPCTSVEADFEFPDSALGSRMHGKDDGAIHCEFLQPCNDVQKDIPIIHIRG